MYISDHQSWQGQQEQPLNGKQSLQRETRKIGRKVNPPNTSGQELNIPADGGTRPKRQKELRCNIDSNIRPESGWQKKRRGKDQSGALNPKGGEAGDFRAR